MSTARSLATFEEFNENTSRCSAWLKEKDRCCRRNIVAADQERRTMLHKSMAHNQIYDGDDAKELAGLYFCNGWHRPGGIYAISSSETRKLLQLFPPRAPEYGPQLHRAVRRRELQISSPTDETQESALRHLSNREIIPFSVAQPALQCSRHNTSELSEAERLSLSIARSAVRDSGHKASELSEAERLSFSIALSAMQSFEYEMSTSSDSAVQQIAQTEPDQPRRSSPPSPAESDRKDRLVDVDENCTMCLLALGDPTGVTRCKFCYGDLHINCAVEWLTTPESATRCISCRHNLENDDITALIGLVRDPLEKERFQRQYELKTGQPEQEQLLTPPPTGENRRNRPVDVDENCPICTLALEDTTKIARCNFCHNDLHRNCLVKWLVTPISVERCPSCRTNVEENNIIALIRSVRDPVERRIFQQDYELKKGRIFPTE